MGEKGIQNTLATRKPIPRLRLIDATASMIFNFFQHETEGCGSFICESKPWLNI
jgi:hypothetical protein